MSQNMIPSRKLIFVSNSKILKTKVSLKFLIFFLILSSTYFSFGKEIDSVMFPACFQENSFYICKDTPGILDFFATNPQKVKKGTLVIDFPDFLKFSWSGYNQNKKENKDGEKIILADNFTNEQVKRDGKVYQRVKIELSLPFLNFCRGKKNWNKLSSVLRQSIVFMAKKSSVGNSGEIYWYLEMGQTRSKDQFLKVKVLPPIKMPAHKPEKFSVGLTNLGSPSGEYDEISKKLCAFWKGLSCAETMANLTWLKPIPDKNFVFYYFSGAVCYFPNFRPDPFERDIRLGKYNDKYPTHYDHHHRYGLSLAYMLDDPDGVFAKYMKDGVERFKKMVPYARYICWNFEPQIKEYAQYDLDVFCKRYLKLPKTLSYAQIKERYSKEWDKFRFEQTTQLVKKYSYYFKKYWKEVKIVMVSAVLDPKFKKRNYRGIWTPLDPRDTEKYFDVHGPMLYFQGVRFYDHVEINTRFLKKDFIPWIDPAERSRVFYSRYTPKGVRQNIVACAALGGKGIVFWPVGYMDGRYYQAIADAYAMIGRAEKIYNGTDITKKCSIKPANVVAIQLPDASGKKSTVMIPERQSKIRYKVHRKGTEFVVTLFNYYKKESIIFRVNVPGFMKNVLVEVPPMGVKVLTASPKVDEQKVLHIKLKKIIAKLRKEVLAAQTLEAGDSTVTWRIVDHNPFPALLAGPVGFSGRYTLTIDPKAGAPIIWTCPNPAWDPLLGHQKGRGHLGKVFIMKSGLAEAIDFHLKKFLIHDNKPSLICEYTEKPFSGFQEGIRNELEGLSIQQQWTLSRSGKVELNCTVKNRNRHGKTIETALKFHTYPRVGYKFGSKLYPGILKVDGKTVSNENDGNFLLVKSGKSLEMKIQKSPEKWKKPLSPVTIYAEDSTNTYRETLTIIPDPQFIAFYNWYGDGLTAEFITQRFKLKPKEQISFKIIFNYAFKKKKK